MSDTFLMSIDIAVLCLSFKDNENVGGLVSIWILSEFIFVIVFVI